MSAPTLTLTISDDAIAGLLDTACEGSAIHYWDDSVRCSKVRRGPPKDGDPGWITEFTLDYADPTTEEPRSMVVNYDTVRRGVQALCAPDFQVGPTIRAGILGLIAERSLGSGDVQDVDVILQAAIFGELVYG